MSEAEMFLEFCILNAIAVIGVTIVGSLIMVADMFYYSFTGTSFLGIK